jgi:hypothetical protein
MSNRALYSDSIGGDKTSVTKTTDASGTGTPAVQVIVDVGGTAISKDRALLSLDLIRQRIVEDVWPPA